MASHTIAKRTAWGILFALCLSGQTGCRSVLPGIMPPLEEASPAAFPEAPPPVAVGVAKPREAPPLPPEHLIDLPAALQRAGAENPTIALAREAIDASMAELLQARALVLPTLNAGASFDWHRGNLMNSQGIIRDINRQSLYAGFGAGAVGAGTIAVPGIRLFLPVADVVFAPQAAAYQVSTREYDAAATRNDILLEVATRYFDLLGAEARLAANRLSLSEVAEVARLTANFSKTGQGRQSDADRAEAQALLLRSQNERIAEEIDVAAAELARVLHLDPSLRLRAADCIIPLITLVDPCSDLEDLVRTGLQNRPEIGARGAEVAMNGTLLRRERWRPFLPVLSVGYSSGEFGGGSNRAPTRFGHFNNRTDFDVVAVWTVQNTGLGNLTLARRRAATVGVAEAERLRVINEVRQDVAEAQALALARREAVAVAARQRESAEHGYQRDLVRTRNLEGRPIEVLNNANLLATARQELIRAMVESNQAQFRLFVAMGKPPPG